MIAVLVSVARIIAQGKRGQEKNNGNRENQMIY